MVILFHSHNPGHVIKSNRSETEVCIVGNLFDFLDKAVKIQSLYTVDCRNEIGWG